VKIKLAEAGKLLTRTWSWTEFPKSDASTGVMSTSLCAYIASLHEQQTMLLRGIHTLLGQIQKNTRKKRRRTKKVKP